MNLNKNISVVGIGRLGLCFALTLERGGYNVIGLDIREDYVDEINSKTFDSVEPNVNKYLAESANLEATTCLNKTLEFSDIIFVTLRTESLPSGKYDHSQIEVLLTDLIKLGKQHENKDIVICSNVCPGYSNEIQDRLKDFNYTVSFNPEWIAQGQILSDQETPDLVVIGEANKQSGDRIEQVYKNICSNDPPVHRMDRLSGEITKVGLNCYLTTKLSYANMLGDIAIQSGVDPVPILKAIGTDSRINNKYFKYGYGYGGPCFPRDVRALTYYADCIGSNSDIVKAVITINKVHLKNQVDYFTSNFDKYDPVVISQVTYKNGVTIIEESQQLLFAFELVKKGYKVIIKESHEVVRQVKELYGDIFKYIEV